MFSEKAYTTIPVGAVNELLVNPPLSPAHITRVEDRKADKKKDGKGCIPSAPRGSLVPLPVAR